jgi:hypothetical protein
MPAMGTDHFGHRRQVPANDLGDLPGRDLLGEGGEPANVGEQDRHLQLPLERERRR